MIKLIDIKKSFKDKDVLKGISTTFLPGKCNLLIGQSGAGKTVTIKSMVGLLETDSGKILFNDRDFSAMNFDQRKAIRREIGMLFQHAALFDSYTVEENIKFPLDMFHKEMTNAEKTDRVNFCLERVNLPGVNNKMPSELSGGMQKRVGIARAIVNNPKYLFCDEPNSGLDPKTSIVIDELIHSLTKEFGTTTIINSHDMNSVLGIGEHIVYLHEGKKHWEGSNGEVIHSGNKELDEFIFASKFLQNLKKGN
jgi:phospholipid/cholesterol/gamma-HCH transport system ATP-binding protein